MFEIAAASDSATIVTAHVLGERVVAARFDATKLLPKPFTDAEREVAFALLAGRSSHEIAVARGTSVNTVANQLAAIFRKVGVNSRFELAHRVLTLCVRCDDRTRCASCPMKDNFGHRGQTSALPAEAYGVLLCVDDDEHWAERCREVFASHTYGATDWRVGVIELSGSTSEFVAGDTDASHAIRVVHRALDGAPDVTSGADIVFDEGACDVVFFDRAVGSALLFHAEHLRRKALLETSVVDCAHRMIAGLRLRASGGGARSSAAHSLGLPPLPVRDVAPELVAAAPGVAIAAGLRHALWAWVAKGTYVLGGNFFAESGYYVVFRETPPGLLSSTGLTCREHQAVALAARGHSNKALAARMGVSLSTVAGHLRRAGRKLRVSGRMELVTTAALLVGDASRVRWPSANSEELVAVQSELAPTTSSVVDHAVMTPREQVDERGD